MNISRTALSQGKMQTSLQFAKLFGCLAIQVQVEEVDQGGYASIEGPHRWRRNLSTDSDQGAVRVCMSGQHLSCTRASNGCCLLQHFSLVRGPHIWVVVARSADVHLHIHCHIERLEHVSVVHALPMGDVCCSISHWYTSISTAISKGWNMSAFDDEA